MSNRVKPPTFVFRRPSWKQIVGIYCTAFAWDFEGDRLRVMLQKNRFGWYPPFARLTGPDPKACVREAFREAGVVKLRVGVPVRETSQWLLKRVFGWLAWSQSPLFNSARPSWRYADELDNLHPGFSAVVVDARRTLLEEVLPDVYEKFDTVCRYVKDDDWTCIKKALARELHPQLRNMMSLGWRRPNTLELHLAARLRASSGREVVFRTSEGPAQGVRSGPA